MIGDTHRLQSPQESKKRKMRNGRMLFNPPTNQLFQTRPLLLLLLMATWTINAYSIITDLVQFT